MTNREQLKRSTPAALLATALWALLQTVRITTFPTLQAMLTEQVAVEWLYPAIIDGLIGLSAPLIAWLIWRKAGFWPRLVALIWFSVSLLEHVETLALNQISARPDAWFGASQTAVGVMLGLVAVLDALAIAVLWQHLQQETATDPAGQLKPPRGLMIAFLLWAALQIPRLIAIPILQNIFSGGTDHPAWLLPALGDIVIALSAPVVMWLVARKRGRWVWAAALTWLFLSVYDHMSTLIAATYTPPAHIFGGGATINPGAAAAPAIQTGVDLLLFLALVWWLSARQKSR